MAATFPIVRRLAVLALLLATGCNVSLNSCLNLPTGKSPGPQKLGVGFTLDAEDANGLAEASLTNLEQMGVTWARVPLSWAQVQPTRDRQDWRTWDYLAQAAARHHVRLLLVVQDTASWASSAPFATNRGSYPPASYEDWFRFVATAAARYKEYVHDWEVWDGIDRRRTWAGQPDQYAKLLSYASQAIRSIDPQARILMGSATFAPDRESQFMDSLFQDRTNPISQSVDALGLRLGVVTPGELRERYFALRRTMTQRDIDKPISITGIDWSADPVRQSDCGAYSGGEAGQARYMRETMPWVLALGAERVFWDRLWDGPSDTPEGTLGLIDRAMQPKAAVGTLAGLIDPNHVGRPSASDGQATPSDGTAQPLP